MPQINVGLIQSRRPSPAAGLENKLRYQEQLGLQRQQLEEKQSQFRQQAEAKKLETRLDFMQEYQKRQAPEESAKTWNKMFDMIGVEGEIGPDSVKEFDKEFEALQKAMDKTGMSGNRQTDEIQTLINKYASTPALEKQIESLEDQKGELEKQGQIAPQAAALSQQLWASGYREGSKGPDEIADDIAGMLMRGETIDQVRTTYGMAKPGAGAKTRDKVERFETVSKFTPEQRGTPAYEKAYADFEVKETKPSRPAETKFNNARREFLTRFASLPGIPEEIKDQLFNVNELTGEVRLSNTAYRVLPEKFRNLLDLALPMVESKVAAGAEAVAATVEVFNAIKTLIPDEPQAPDPNQEPPAPGETRWKSPSGKTFDLQGP